ncbi:alpha/beta hydrolase [Photobacterium rosenbergii]|uniref:alpha/beta hydrolase n=1 Tax=Photobacterium rosenbergii TaxID=294936 RepID=UPI001C99271F|nr:alpha/beta fold hydrolase [Photobacterium rosenbergii]MBY5944023.1 alpha/beta fold hydrolase [Photobacterium rosenbergii]
MKKSQWVIVIAAILAGLYTFSPRVDTSFSYKELLIPQDIEGFVTAQEHRFPDIMPGTEKKITWAGEPNRRTAYSVVYLHGFSSSRQDTAPLAHLVANQLEANLFEARLKGHGRPADVMKSVTVNDWLNDARHAYDIGAKLGDKVVVIGLSTGGTLALWLAAQPELSQLSHTVLISPNLGPADSNAELLLLPLGDEIARLVVGDYREWKPVNEQQAQFWTTRYPVEALVTMMGVVDVTRNQPVEHIITPVLTLYSEQDRIVDIAKTQAMLERLPLASRQSIVISDSGDKLQHVLAGDILSPKTTDQVAKSIVEFIKVKK